MDQGGTTRRWQTRVFPREALATLLGEELAFEMTVRSCLWVLGFWVVVELDLEKVRDFLRCLLSPSSVCLRTLGVVLSQLTRENVFSRCPMRRASCTLDTRAPDSKLALLTSEQ